LKIANKESIHLTAYTKFLKIRKSFSGQGVAIFVLETPDCVVREGITIDQKICDCLFSHINLTVVVEIE